MTTGEIKLLKEHVMDYCVIHKINCHIVETEQPFEMHFMLHQVIIRKGEPRREIKHELIPKIITGNFTEELAKIMTFIKCNFAVDATGIVHAATEEMMHYPVIQKNSGRYPCSGVNVPEEAAKKIMNKARQQADNCIFGINPERIMMDEYPENCYMISDLIASMVTNGATHSEMEKIARCSRAIIDLAKKYSGDDAASAKKRNTFPGIKKVLFNPPATIIFWSDNTKTVVKVKEGDIYDPEKGMAMAVCKKLWGNTRDYYNIFKQWKPDWKWQCGGTVNNDGKVRNKSDLEREEKVDYILGKCNTTFHNSCTGCPLADRQCPGQYVNKDDISKLTLSEINSAYTAMAKQFKEAGEKLVEGFQEGIKNSRPLIPGNAIPLGFPNKWAQSDDENLD